LVEAKKSGTKWIETKTYRLFDPFEFLERVFDIIFFLCMQLQIVVWFVIPAVKHSTVAHVNHTLSLIVLIQFIPRLFQIFPLQRRILKTSGLIAKTALAGALYNLGSYMLASHVTIHTFYYISCYQFPLREMLKEMIV